jgi:hypothetical protein
VNIERPTPNTVAPGKAQEQGKAQAGNCSKELSGYPIPPGKG